MTESGQLERNPHSEESSAQSDVRKDVDINSTSKEGTPIAAEQPESTKVPLLVVEKTDDKPVYGEDFGGGATISQTAAHDMRAADALPDRIIVTPEAHSGRSSEDEESAPLFRHESIEADQSTSTSATETIDETSTQSSSNRTSSEDLINTPPPDADVSQDDEEYNREPLLSHEVDITKPYGEHGNGLLLSYEMGSEEEDVNELDAAPLLPHETGFSSYKGSNMGYNSRSMNNDKGYQARNIEPDDVPKFTHEEDEDDYEEDDAPLLPHERDSAIVDHYSHDEDGPFMMHRQGTFPHESDNATTLFGGSGRPGLFRTSTDSSTLPHKLPQSDAEDENLLDPGLERFPTNRDRILERVASIGLHLPEDQTMEDPIHSPVMSVLSQACSSIDLVPVKSYTSLASVPEIDYSDEEGEDDDMESLPSPVAMKLSRATFARHSPARILSEDSKRHWSTESKSRDKDFSEVDSAGKNDGTNDPIVSTLPGAIATSLKVFSPVTPPLTPEKENRSKDATVSEPQLRQRQIPQEDTASDSSTPLNGQNEQDSSNREISSSNPKHLDKPHDNFFYNFLHVVFGTVAHFLTACVGDRKRAG
jgi:hypothetical protein